MLDLNTWVIVFVITTVVLVVAAVVLWEAFR
jgi:hypothetical protein